MRFIPEILDSHKEYRFIARLVDLPIWYVSNSTTREIREWCDEQGVCCSQVGSQFFFRSEDDRMLFLLRWSQ